MSTDMNVTKKQELRSSHKSAKSSTTVVLYEFHQLAVYWQTVPAQDLQGFEGAV